MERSWEQRKARLGSEGPRTWAGAQLKQCQHVFLESTPEQPTSKGKLGRGISASLVVSDQTQDLAEAGHGQQTTVLCVCDLPYLAQDSWLELGALEELDGNLARYDAELLCVCLLEEVLEDALLVRCEVEDGLVCAALARTSTRYPK